MTLSRRREENLSRQQRTKDGVGSEGTVRLDSVDSIERASSDGEEGGVSRADEMDEGVAGRVEMGAMNLKTGVADAGGVGGFIGRIWRGDGGSGGIERTVAMELRNS